MPMITKQAWFGPKQTFGWGWTPVSWQGWTVTGVYFAAFFGFYFFFGATRIGFAGMLGCTVLLIVVAKLTGTDPGGPNWE